MGSPAWLGWALLGVALIPRAFLITTLTHLEALNIPARAPARGCGGTFVVGFAVAGLAVLLR